MEHLHAPYILVEGGDVTFFRSIADVLGWVEAVDVIAGVYSLFDANGHVLTFRTQAGREPWEHAGRVFVEPTETRAVEELRQILVMRARAPDLTVLHPEHMSLEDLVASLATRLGFR